MEALEVGACRIVRDRLALSVGVVSTLTACGGSIETSTADFGTDSPVDAVVVENVTACTVDAVCGLRLRFADTTVFAAYGTGERDSDGCPIDVQVSDAAFGASTGQAVTVVLRHCEGVGLVLGDLRTRPDGG